MKLEFFLRKRPHTSAKTILVIRIRAHRKGPLKPDADSLPTLPINFKLNTCLQYSVDKKNPDLPVSDAGRHHLVKTIKQTAEELDRWIQMLVGEKEDLMASATREQMEAKKQIRDLQGENQKLKNKLKLLKGRLRGVQDNHLHTVRTNRGFETERRPNFLDNG